MRRTATRLTAVFMATSAGVALAVARGSSASPSTAPPCQAVQLRASISLQGATGHLVGPMRVRNHAAACTLTGRPQLALLRADGRRFRASQSSGSPGWRFVTRRPPRGWPVVHLARGERASALLTLTNWCQGNGAKVRFMAALPNRGGTVRTAARIRLRCESAAAPASLAVGPFEPSAGSLDG